MPQDKKGAKKKTAVRESKPLGSSPSMGPMAIVPAAVGLRTATMLQKKRVLKAPSAAKKAYEKAKAKKK